GEVVLTSVVLCYHRHSYNCTPTPLPPLLFFFFFHDPATTEIYTLSLHDALPISRRGGMAVPASPHVSPIREVPSPHCVTAPTARDRKSTRLNSSHVEISYAVFCLKKKKQKEAVGQFYKVEINARLKKKHLTSTKA